MSKILLVDDDPVERTRLRTCLLGKGHEVVEAHGGKQGLELFLQQKFDCLITDLVMPVMDGIELIYRARMRDPHLSIIAISDCAPPGNSALFDAAAELGANASVEMRNFPDALELIASWEDRVAQR